MIGKPFHNWGQNWRQRTNLNWILNLNNSNIDQCQFVGKMKRVTRRTFQEHSYVRITKQNNAKQQRHSIKTNKLAIFVSDFRLFQLSSTSLHWKEDKSSKKKKEREKKRKYISVMRRIESWIDTRCCGFNKRGLV